VRATRVNIWSVTLAPPASLFLHKKCPEFSRGQRASSERYKKPEQKKKDPATPPAPRVKKPSERYPNIPVRAERVEITPLPSCEVCGQEMQDSGMVEESEQLTVIPKKFEIIRIARAKYRCSCQACITTAPVPPRIIPGSRYSDEMILDVVLSKYCDLIPMERYAAMAARGGLKDLPPQSLIDLTHGAAEFFAPLTEKIRQEVLSSRVLHADETPHPMLEGSDKKSWHLWGFSNKRASFFECHPTRSGDVASSVLNQSQIEVLVSDVLEAQTQGQDPPGILELREKMRARFNAMRDQALSEWPKYPYKNKFQTALKYFLENFDGLTFFLKDAQVPIDNNLQERALRSPVVGRKTWYGTHSDRTKPHGPMAI
jgi:transposase